MTFFLLFTISLTHVIMKLLSVALFSSASSLLTASYLAGDMLLYVFYRKARGDLNCWLNLPVGLRVVTSVLLRTAAKIMLDFTAVVHLRHPLELGGFYWGFSLFANQASCFLAGYAFLRYEYEAGADNTGVVSSEMFLWAVLGTGFALWVVSFVAFFLTIDAKYYPTFTSVQSGRQHVADTFRNATTDEEKVLIFKRHPDYYERIQEEVKGWVHENWDTWQTDKPTWFTEKVVRMIPDSFIPAQDLKEIEQAGGRERKKSSVEIVFGGGAGGAAGGEGVVAGLARRLSVGVGVGRSSAVAPEPALLPPSAAAATE